jgi:predicted permease
MKTLRAVGRRLIPYRWRETVERDLVHEASRRALTGRRRDIWIALHSIRIGTAFRWRALGTSGRPRPGDVMVDLRYALRQWTRQPAFAVAAIATLALAIAANTTMFAMTDAVMFRALPFAEPDRLVWITSVRSDSPDAPVTLAEFMDYRERTRSLDGLAAYSNWSAILSSGDGMAERLQGSRMSANVFSVLGIRADAGRLLNDDDDRADAARVAVISHRLWQQRFGGAADVVGREVRINGDPTLVVGVLPAHFPLPLRDIDVIVPLVPDRDPIRHVRASTNFLRLLGRLQPGVSREQAQQELTAICTQLRTEFPVPYARKLSISVTPLSWAVVGNIGPTLLLLLGSVVVVLSTALANLLCLVLVRTNDRRGELSIRVALGASRHRLVRQLAIEALAMAVVAGVIGTGLAVLATSSATAWAPAAIPRLAEVRCDGRALLVAAVLTLGSSVLFTLAPLGTLWRTGAQHALRLVSRGSIGDRTSHRVRDGLVIAEISAALVLLLATSLLVREFLTLQRVAPGFTPDAVFQARVSLPVSYRTPADVTRYYDEVMRQLTALPGVRSAGLITAAPLSGLLLSVPFSVVGRVEEPGARTNTNFRVITPGYLAAAGTRVLRGRAISDRDRPETSPVALVSEAFADRWLGAEPLGQRVMINDNNTGPRPVDVVGIVENVRQSSLDGPPASDLYIPLSQIHPDGITIFRSFQFWMVRTDADPEALKTSFVKALQTVDRDVAVSGMGTMRQGLENWFAPRRFSLTMFVAFSLTAVLLAVSGLYGLVSYAVSQRRREIGLRMALGASIVDVRRLILRDAAKLAVIGIALGVVLVLAARPLKSWLIGDATIDPVLASAATLVLFLVVVLAGALPAYRASRIQPTVVLKE